MLLTKNNLTIRNATVDDAEQLSAWWNDGKIMAHAGFPNGTGQTAPDIANSLMKDTDDTHRRLIIVIDDVPAGEMNYRNMGNSTAELGIKICDFTKRDKGYGKVLLSMVIRSLFDDFGYSRIILDTNVNNKRAQHVYEQLGFRRLRVRENSWKNQLGELQSSIDYEMYQTDFNDYSK